MPFFAYPESVRRIIYTSNAIEALNARLRRAVRARGHLPNDDAAYKARTQFAVVFGARFVSQ